MELTEAMKSRKSIRAYLPQKVSKELLTGILDLACRAPSAMNTQPWEFVVISGETLDRIRAAIVRKLNNQEPMQPEHHAAGWPADSIYRKRQVELAKQLFKLMDIPREDKVKRAAWLERGFRFFDAPAAIILTTDRALSENGPLLDLGAVMQNICLAATDRGLGTCIEDQGVLYPAVVREMAGIPDSKKIIIAIAIGYPDPDFPANQVCSEREPLEHLTTWIGFE
ncbi:MAG: nitroreductase [Thermodesulfobacteriota bacterium]|nr:nitroreductase [Thermodesulfobacteriota bacterium]